LASIIFLLFFNNLLSNDHKGEFLLVKIVLGMKLSAFVKEISNIRVILFI